MEQSHIDCSLTSERGFSLFELVLVLAIGGALLAGGWVAASNFAESRRQSLAQQQIVQIRDNMRKFHTTRAKTESGLITDDMEEVGVFPKEMQTGTPGLLKNPWEGPVTIYGEGSAFSIHTDSIPKAACNRLAVATMRDAQQTGLVRGVINGGEDVTDATIGNLECTEERNNEMSWYYTLRK